jgi:hypothetical protein
MAGHVEEQPDYLNPCHLLSYYLDPALETAFHLMRPILKVRNSP